MADMQGGYQGMGAQAEAPTVVMNYLHQQHHSPAERKPRDKHKSTLYGLGIAEIVIGCISMLLAIVTLIIAGTGGSYWYLYVARSMTYPAQGLWGGLILTITGFLGVKAKTNPSVCMYNANMVMSIITANIAAVVVIMSGIASAYSTVSSGSLVALHAIIAVLAFTAFVICIIHSAYCCAGVCCRSKLYPYAATYIPQHSYMAPPAQQMLQLSNGQFVMVPYQPTAPSNYAGYPTGVIGSPVMFQGSAVASPTTRPTQVPMPYGCDVSTQQTAGNNQQVPENPPSYTA